MADVTISQLPQGIPSQLAAIPYSEGGITRKVSPNLLLKNSGSIELGGSLIFSQDLTEYFIKPPSNGGAIRFRGNAATGADRQLELGHMDNLLNWESIMLIAEGGKVGINTRTPSVALEVNGTIKANQQPAFLAYGVFTKTVGWTNVSQNLLTESYDIGNNYSTSGPTAGRFTAPVAGRYMFYGGGWAATPTPANDIDQRYGMGVNVNGGAVTPALQFISGGNYSITDTPMSGYTVVLNLNANDYVDFWGFSAILTTWGNEPNHKFYWGGYLLG